MRSSKGILAAVSCSVLACSLVQSLDSLTNEKCPVGMKACKNVGTCIPNDEPTTGCAADSCAPCEFANAQASCVDGKCAIKECNAGYCGRDKCEACSTSNGVFSCSVDEGKCVKQSCNEGFEDCNEDPSDGCETDLRTDQKNCRICGRECKTPHAAMSCHDQQCLISKCDPGFEDCNKSAPDGCEAELNKNTENCGGCGHVCASGRKCQGGKCIEADGLFTGAASEHACATLTPKSLWCWGKNDSGQLGYGATATLGSTTAVQVPNLSGIVAAAAGLSHTCAINDRGLVFCWGANAFGQCGTNTTAQTVLVPKALAGLTDVQAVAAGSNHTCVLRADRTVWCWGQGDKGQIGDGQNQQKLIPTQVLGVDGQALNGVVQISAGGDFSCARQQPGSVFCWGDNSSGQLGLGSGSSQSVNVASAAVIDSASDVACGTNVMCVIRSSGALGFAYCAGKGDVGQLGTGSVGDSSSLQKVNVVSGLSFSAVRVGGRHACGIMTSSNNLWCWGSTAKGQLFAEPTNPYSLTPELAITNSIAMVALGLDFSCILQTGSVYCVGSNSSGQIGFGTAPDNSIHPNLNKVNNLP